MPKIEISTFIAMSLFTGGLLFYQLHLYAVSYTHLDVYKRQILPFAALAN